MAATSQLDQLFVRWRDSYPPQVRAGFHADGIIDEELYARTAPRVLFVMAEPNSTGGAYDKYYGQDIRRLYGEVGIIKTLTQNLALWTRVLVDGATEYAVLGKTEVRAELRRIAIINLKKFSGSGTADFAQIGVHAWQDRMLIREEVSLIDPQLIITCGERIHRLFASVMSDDRFITTEDDWVFSSTPVINAQHPSTRGSHTRPAFARVRELASRFAHMRKR